VIIAKLIHGTRIQAHCSVDNTLKGDTLCCVVILGVALEDGLMLGVAVLLALAQALALALAL